MMMNTRRTIWLYALTLTLGCTDAGSDGPVDVVDDCADELSGDWESVTEFECPLVDPNCTYRHQLSFDGEDFSWMPADQTFEGPYTCEDGVVEALDKIDDSVVFTGTYDVEADTLELTWEGLEAPEAYQRK